MKFLFACLFPLFPALAAACELCAIYNATSARGESSSGFLFTLSQQFIPFRTLQTEGRPSPLSAFFQSASLDTSITHFVPGYNFSDRFGVSLNVPYIYREFRRTEFPPILNGMIKRVDESGQIHGLGDTALVGRWTALQKSEMDYSSIFNVLAGVKFPTGDTTRLDDEVAQERLYNLAYPAGHTHAIGGIHQHDLSLGSGSFDGVFGATANLRWRRWFFNSQFQYYLRTEARSYQFGDTIMLSGGPGVYALLGKTYTLSLQANAFYESAASDVVLSQTATQTGTTSWYFGPQVGFTWGTHFSANAGADLPLHIYNHGTQSVPDYRFHAGVTWRF